MQFLLYPACKELNGLSHGKDDLRGRLNFNGKSGLYLNSSGIYYFLPKGGRGEGVGWTQTRLLPSDQGSYCLLT